MEKIDFTVDSKDKVAFSIVAKIFHYILGLSFIVSSLFTISRFSGVADMDMVVYLNVGIFLVGVLWIVMGVAGRQFVPTRKYIILTSDSLRIKKNYKKEVVLSKESIVDITINLSKISITSQENSIDFETTWFTFPERQKFKEQLAIFCRENNIVLK